MFVCPTVSELYGCCHPCFCLALDVDPVLNMLVFGESILNDAVAIVLTTTIVGKLIVPNMLPWATPFYKNQRT